MHWNRMAAILAAGARLCPAAPAPEWPEGPNKLDLEKGQRPDNARSSKRWTDPKSLMGCGVTKAVKADSASHRRVGSIEKTAGMPA